ncbi:hypothetical protein BDB01DRAFT_800428 [Pilobolus umbonatus]|nr:hypothetical protein BDB01DRAFT_800428 [Pilobolus umbonatus]
MDWKVTISKEEKKKENPEPKAEPLQAKTRELSRILSRLTKLLHLRRKKLESKGHFFPDEGNAFYEKVKEWNEQNQKPVEVEDVNKKVIDEQDVWNNKPLDENAYLYWCEANQSTTSLLRIRKQWDYYLSQNKESESIHMKVPPIWVLPSPPANWVWATCLK